MARARKASSSKESSSKPPPRKVSLTLRLDEARFRKLELLAEAENRTPTSYAETAVLRDMAAKEEAARAITVLVPPEAAALAPGPLLRTEGESDERYAERSALLDRLFAIPDAD